MYQLICKTVLLLYQSLISVLASQPIPAAGLMIQTPCFSTNARIGIAE